MDNSTFDVSAASKLARYLSPSRWEDIVQDAYLIWHKNNSHSVNSCVRWAHKHIKQYNGAKSRQCEPISKANEPSWTPPEEVEDVNAYVLQLEGRARQVAELMLQGKSKTEIATALGVSKPRVSALLADMRAKLSQV